MPRDSELRLEPALADAWPVDQWRDSHVVVGISGGADSVALLRAILATKARARGRGEVFAAHLHHGFRGVEADADQAWLERLCAQLGAQLTVGRADLMAALTNGGNGWEAAARAARYDFLLHSAERIGARFVAVAHTADDQVETVLHRVVRGTGLAGLAGMPKFRPLSASVTLVRPLLEVWRTAVLEYLSAIGQDYRVDLSNLDPRFTRNRLRHELLPLLRKSFNREVDAAILRLSIQAGEAQRLTAKIAAALAERCVAIDAESRVRINRQMLSNLPPLVVREVFKLAWTAAGWPQQAMGFDQWQQLADLVLGESDCPAIQLPGGVRAAREGDTVVLSQMPNVY
jgi:tRNA(Ile)-lysidine synthase